MFCGDFRKCFVSGSVEICSVALEKKMFLNFVNVFSLICYYLPLEKDGTPYLNKLESQIPFTQRCFVPSLVENSHVVLERKIFKACLCIFAISSLSPLGKGRGSLFEQASNPFTKKSLCKVLLKLAKWFEEDGNVKSLQTDRRQAIRNAHLYFQLR